MNYKYQVQICTDNPIVRKKSIYASSDDHGSLVLAIPRDEKSPAPFDFICPGVMNLPFSIWCFGSENARYFHTAFRLFASLNECKEFLELYCLPVLKRKSVIAFRASVDPSSAYIDLKPDSYFNAHGAEYHCNPFITHRFEIPLYPVH